MTDIVERLRAITREAIAEIELLRGNGKQPPNMAFLDTPLIDIDFGRLMNGRVHHLKTWVLKDNGEMVLVPIITVRDLVMLTEAAILRSPNVGRASLESIKTVLANHGLHLGIGL